MHLDPYRRFAYRHFRRAAVQGARRNTNLSRALQRAHMTIRPDVYIASLYLTSLIVTFAGLLVVIVYGVGQYLGYLPGRLTTTLIMLPVPLAAAGTVHLFGLLQPDLKARTRARDINAKLPYALNYISTMAAAGATPQRIFHGLSQQSIYGQVAEEAAWIDRDLNVLGYDLIQALNVGIDRSPSQRWQDLLQGAITVLTSGGDIKGYFSSKSEQFMYDNRQEQKKFLESLGVLAESFVVVVAAAPLFLIVILSVMTMFGNSATQSLAMGYILVLVMLPFAQAGFVYTIKTMTPEA